MSWLFSQALVAEYSAATCSDGGQSVPLNTSRMPLLYLPSVKMTAFSRHSRFGMTFGHSTVESGAALLMWFRVDFLARTSAQQEPGPESPESVLGSGEKWRGSFAKYDRDSSTWKTHQYSLLGDLTLYSETWPRWGLMRDGECWELPTPFGVLELRRQITSAIECGSLERIPTPTGQDNNQVRGEGAAANHPARGTTLGGYVRRYPSPGANDWRSGKGWDAQAQKSRGHSPQLRHILDGMLNPEFAEWLMGWPIGWTALDPLVMDRCRNAQLRHGGC